MQVWTSMEGGSKELCKGGNWLDQLGVCNHGGSNTKTAWWNDCTNNYVLDKWGLGSGMQDKGRRSKWLK